MLLVARSLPYIFVGATLIYGVWMFRVTTEWYDERLNEQAFELSLLSRQLRQYERTATE